jgi:hypothetical protein
MSKVFFSVCMSLDGFIAPETRSDDPKFEKWMSQWMELQKWVFAQKFFRENLKLGAGGETGQDNTLLEETYNRTGSASWGSGCSTEVRLAGRRKLPSIRRSSS